MILKKGDKVRIKATDEGAEIVEVIDEFHALVDTFDGVIEIHAKQVIPYQSSDVRETITSELSFAKEQKPTQETGVANEAFSFNNRKNRFNYELDLHAEQLIGTIDTKSNEEILSIQINRIKPYIDEAIELRIQRVYIIHGIGSGRLKAEVENILHKHPQIVSFQNKYHPKYGKGATEVILKR